MALILDAALQVSGYQNPYLAAGLVVVALLWTFIASWRWLRRRNGRPGKTLGEVAKIERDERTSPRGHKTVAIRFLKTISPAIEGCKVRLERLELWDRARGDGGAWTPRQWFAPLLLCWSYNDGGGATQTLPAGVGAHRSCDLAVNEGDPNKSFIAAAQDQLRHANSLIPGRWRFECVLEAENSEASRFEGVMLFKSAPPGPTGPPNTLTFEELSWDGVDRFNELIERADALVQRIFNGGRADAESAEELARWNQNAERLIERHGDGSQLTDFRTAAENDKDFGKGMALSSEAWSIVRKANAQTRVLRRCRESLS